ncbi:hypothetical protein P8452_66692 [Trifolium repens]|nr:hypothetical protein P8452_66692 [Trifolium repens]
MDRVLLQERTVEGDDLVDMKSERKHVESVKRLRSEFKRLKSEVKRLKLERKQLKSEVGTSEITFYRVPDRKESIVEEVERLKSEVKRLKSKLKRIRSPFDAIDPPPNSLKPGRARIVLPVSITDENRPFLIELSKLALEKYNDDNNQDPQFKPFEYDELVKSTLGSWAGPPFVLSGHWTSLGLASRQGMHTLFLTTSFSLHIPVVVSERGSHFYS